MQTEVLLWTAFVTTALLAFCAGSGWDSRHLCTSLSTRTHWRTTQGCPLWSTDFRVASNHNGRILEWDRVRFVFPEAKFHAWAFGRLSRRHSRAQPTLTCCLPLTWTYQKYEVRKLAKWVLDSSRNRLPAPYTQRSMMAGTTVGGRNPAPSKKS